MIQLLGDIAIAFAIAAIVFGICWYIAGDGGPRSNGGR